MILVHRILPTYVNPQRIVKRLALGIALLALLALPTVDVAAQGPGLTATMQFGNPDAGSPFPPGVQHDQSGNAKDNLIPRTVVISRGGSVTFNVQGRHWPAVYAAGTSPKDINPALFPANPGCPPIGRVNDPTGRLFETPTCVTNAPVTTPAGLFSTPGRYLVICELHPHFVDNDMYGWVNVQ